MITKRPIFNHNLQCVAYEVLAPKEMFSDPQHTPIILDFITHFQNDLPIFLPFSLKTAIEQIDKPILNPVILKLSADELETKHSLSEIEDSLFSIALLINTPQQLTWLNIAEYIALTEDLMNQTNISKIVEYTKSKRRKIIAYSLEEPISFEKCKKMSMDYFCGDFLFKPDLTDTSDIAANKLNVLQLIQKLQKEDSDLQEISKTIQCDPLLSFQLLKLANSVAFSCGNPIESIDNAVTRLGLFNLRKWVMYFSLQNISEKPQEILESGLIRANMAERLAKSNQIILEQSAYTAGLLSILDCLLNKSMENILNEITLAEDIKQALVFKSGPLGFLLDQVIAYEEGQWDKINHTHFNGIELSKLYIDTLAFVSNSSN